MSSISTSIYHKYVELQNVSASGDPASAPEGGIYLFASGTSAAPNTARLYLQNEAGNVTDIAKSLDIDAFDALGGTGLHQTQDHFVFSDNGTEKKITFSNLQDAVFADVSGDATIAAGGALTIAAQAVENSMLADDAVGADELAANAVVNASIASNAAIDMDKLDGGSLASSLSDLAQTDLLYAGDADASNALKSITFSNFEDAIFGNVSGDATIAAGGALTIANDAVEQAMIADDAVGNDQLANITRGSVKVGGAANAPTDLDAKTSGQILVGDGTDIASVAVSGDVSLAANGAVTIAANAVEGSMLNSNVAGTGLDYSSDELSVDVSDFMTNGANNRIVTATGTDGMNGEANLQFDGTNLVLVGNMSGSGAFQTVGGISIGGASSGFSGSVSMNALAVGGGYSDGGTGLSVSAAGALQFNGALTVGSSGEGVDSTFHGGTANEAFIYDASENHIKIQDSSSNTLVTMGGDATSDYGVDVGGGSAGTNNINKVRASAFVTFSDESLKKDIEQMNGALDTVMSLKGVEFTWKNSDSRDFGFIAQEVQEVLPQAVHENAGVHGVDYSRLTSVLVEAVKAQQIQIEELKAILKK